MVKILLLIYLISIVISIPGLLNKAGYSMLQGLIPFYNIYLLIELLEINPLLLIVLSLLIIFLPDRLLIITMILIFLPFIIADAYDKGIIIGLLSLILPFIFLPYIAYLGGCYRYNMED